MSSKYHLGQSVITSDNRRVIVLSIDFDKHDMNDPEAMYTVLDQDLGWVAIYPESALREG